MIETPHIAELAGRLTARISFSVTPEGMRKEMGPGFEELMGALSAQGLTPAGSVCAHHFHRPNDRFDFELTVPLARPVTPVGRVQPGHWPAMRAVRTVYHGAYEGLPSAWSEFMRWIEAQNLPIAEDFYESYVLGPRSSGDPADWRTELLYPLQEGHA